MRKPIFLLFLAVSLCLSGCQKEKKEDLSVDAVKLEENQELLTVQIDEICGNEITYTVAEESNMPAQRGSQNSREKNSEKSEGSQESENEKNTEGNQMKSGDEMPPGGEMSSGDEMPPGGEMSSGDEMPQRGEISSSEQMSGERQFSKENMDEENSEKTGEDDQEQVFYTLTAETGTSLIPVGTEVVTQLETVTTFSRLSAGDIVKMLVETDTDNDFVIVGIWMVS